MRIPRTLAPVLFTAAVVCFVVSSCAGPASSSLGVASPSPGPSPKSGPLTDSTSSFELYTTGSGSVTGSVVQTAAGSTTGTSTTGTSTTGTSTTGPSTGITSPVDTAPTTAPAPPITRAVTLDPTSVPQRTRGGGNYLVSVRSADGSAAVQMANVRRGTTSFTTGQQTSTADVAIDFDFPSVEGAPQHVQASTGTAGDGTVGRCTVTLADAGTVLTATVDCPSLRMVAPNGSPTGVIYAIRGSFTVK